MENKFLWETKWETSEITISVSNLNGNTPSLSRLFVSGKESNLERSEQYGVVKLFLFS